MADDDFAGLFRDFEQKHDARREESKRKAQEHRLRLDEVRTLLVARAAPALEKAATGILREGYIAKVTVNDPPQPPVLTLFFTPSKNPKAPHVPSSSLRIGSNEARTVQVTASIKGIGTSDVGAKGLSDDWVHDVEEITDDWVAGLARAFVKQVLKANEPM
jgi:hypothetical protein